MSTITGNGRPTDRTKGMVGDIYTDLLSGNKYNCVGIYEIVTDVTTYYYMWVQANINSQETNSNGQYVDQTTGRIYALKVDNGKLTMEEV